MENNITQTPAKQRNRVVYFFFGERPLYFNVVFYTIFIIAILKGAGAIGMTVGILIAAWILGKSFSWLVVKVSAWFMSKEKHGDLVKLIKDKWYLVFTIFLALYAIYVLTT